MDLKITEQQLYYEHNYLLRSGSGYVILLFPQGSCQLLLHGKEYLCTGSEMVVMKPREVVALQLPTEKNNCLFQEIHFSESTLTELSDEMTALDTSFSFVPYKVAIVHSEAATTAFLRNLIGNLNREMQEDNWGNELYRKSLFTIFLVRFLRACRQSDQVHQKHLRKELIIDDVFRYIGHHLADDLSLETLEKEFFVSGEHLSRKFKKMTGMTLQAYIRRARIDLSKKYLLQDYTIHEICGLCGFESYTHFFRVFKSETGMTPGEYRGTEARGHFPLS